MSNEHWPSWRYGPNGEAQVFDSAAEVPDGWQDHPSKHEEGAKAAPTAETKNSSPPKTAAPKTAAPKKAGRPPKPAPLDL